MVTLLLIACAPPFAESRKDLDGFRLAGLSAADGQLRALVWSGEGAFHSTAPTVTWTIDGVEVTEAPAAPFVARVRVENADGLYEEGELVVDADAFDPVITGAERTFDGVAALAFTVEGDSITRWMASSGTFTETGPHAADWAPEDAPLAAIVGLSIDGRGGVTWAWLDVAQDAGPYAAVGGRLLPVESPLDAEGAYIATVTPAENLAGLVLTDVVPDDGTGAVDTVCGLLPFDVDALADGRCGMDEAAGARIAVQAAPWP